MWRGGGAGVCFPRDAVRTSRKLVIRATGRRSDGEAGVSSERGGKVGLDDVQQI